jgi:hypothetical protein
MKQTIITSVIVSLIWAGVTWSFGKQSFDAGYNHGMAYAVCGQILPHQECKYKYAGKDYTVKSELVVK